MRDHKDLIVCKRSILLAKRIYQLTEKFPKQETYGLTQQMRRAAVSIAANISEGAARRSTKEFIRFLHFSAGSVSELDTHIEIANAIDMGESKDRKEASKDVNDVARLLTALIQSLKNDSRFTNHDSLGE